MNASAGRQKSVSLTFRGFDLAAAEVANLLGVAASGLGNRGEPVKPGVKTHPFQGLREEYALSC